jgi:hypothetical protein
MTLENETRAQLRLAIKAARTSVQVAFRMAGTMPSE